MKIIINVLLCVSLAHASSKFVEKLPEIIVDETNREALGDLPLGTKLILDEKTQLYRPPDISANYSAEDRMQQMWIKYAARDNFCKVGPGRLAGGAIIWDYYYYQFCIGPEGDDICCGTNVCSCSGLFFRPSAKFNCACVHDAVAQRNAQEEKEDYDRVKEIASGYSKYLLGIAGIAAKVVTKSRRLSISANVTNNYNHNKLN